MKLHIKNGRVLDPRNQRDGNFDILVHEGKVDGVIGPGQKITGSEVIDARNCVVAPGFVDLHTHLRDPGYEYKETIETGTRAAVAGGFTSICCMANTNPVNDSASVTQYILKRARESGLANVYPVGALTRGLLGEELSEIGDLCQAGCVALSDDGKTVKNPRVMRMAMEYAKGFGLPVISHAIDQDLAGKGVMHEGLMSTKLGLEGIPSEAEDMIISRDILLCQLTRCPLHIAHLSTKGGLELVRRAKEAGLPVTCEVTPHHLTLTDSAVSQYHSNTKMAPPLRCEDDRVALVQALATGLIDAIATDHAPHAQVDKELEYDEAAFGIVGLETALSLMLKWVHGGEMTLLKLIELLTVNPARIVGLDRGHLSPGAPADIVIFNPDEGYRIDPANFFSKGKNTPFGGMDVKGRVHYTLVGGEIVHKGV